jgi:hypothetical protein
LGHLTALFQKLLVPFRQKDKLIVQKQLISAVQELCSRRKIGKAQEEKALATNRSSSILPASSSQSYKFKDD